MDADNDGVISGRELIAVQQNFGNTVCVTEFRIGDADGYGRVIGADLIII